MKEFLAWVRTVRHRDVFLWIAVAAWAVFVVIALSYIAAWAWGES